MPQPAVPKTLEIKDSRFTVRLLNTVEWLGNLLPHPVTLFAILMLLIVVLSAVAAYFGLQVDDPRPVGAAGRAADGTVAVISLLNTEGLLRILSSLVSNFTSFAPLGTVLVTMLGVGIAEKSGLLSAAMRGMVIGAHPRIVTYIIVFAGVMSNTAGDLGYVVLIPMAAMIFHSLGRHPLAGLAAAFAGVSAGYGANLVLGTLDPLLAGISTAAAQLVDPNYVVSAEMNWYFMASSTVLLSIVGALVTEKLVEPKLGSYTADAASESAPSPELQLPTPTEIKGLKIAGIAFALCAGLLAWAILPEGALLRDPRTGSLAPLHNSMVAIIFMFFAIPGLAYGYVVGTIRNDRDAIHAMSDAMRSLSLYLVLIFFAAQFVTFFKWTNFGSVIAVLGADFLQSTGLTGPGVFFLFIIMCALINLMVGSSSAQWALTAPIFVPMLMLIGFAPETTQAAYRIGDSVTNIVTPMMSYFGLIVAMAAKYNKNIGLGTLIAMMLPYSVVFMVCWSVFFYVWTFVLGLPVGPGAATYYPVLAR